MLKAILIAAIAEQFPACLVPEVERVLNNYPQVEQMCYIQKI